MSTTRQIEENTRVARRYPEEVATERRFDLIEEICTEDVVSHSPFGDVRGREAVREQTESVTAGVSDFSATVEDAVAEGDTVAMRVTLRGTHDGEFLGIPPTGKTFEAANMVFTRLEDGKIAERWVVPDMLGVFQQLGIVESPVPQNEG